MAEQVEETRDVHPAYPERLVHFDEQARTYALTSPNDPAGGTVPISYCPWCATKLRRVLAKGLTSMSPELCRHLRGVVGLSHRRLADQIGESLATVFHYEMGKPTDPAVPEKLLFFFQQFPLAGTRSSRFGFYQR